MTKEIKEYFLKKYKDSNFIVVPGHWPDFSSKEHVDKWIRSMEMMTAMFDETVKDAPKLKSCPICGNHFALKKVSSKNGKHYIKCSHCLAKTGEYETESLALDAWNDRKIS